MFNPSNKVIWITGASSGIGKALAIEMAGKGYDLGIVGRRIKRLNELKDKLNVKVYTKKIDITDLTAISIQLLLIQSLLRRVQEIISFLFFPNILLKTASTL